MAKKRGGGRTSPPVKRAAPAAGRAKLTSGTAKSVTSKATNPGRIRSASVNKGQQGARQSQAVRRNGAKVGPSGKLPVAQQSRGSSTAKPRPSSKIGDTRNEGIQTRRANAMPKTVAVDPGGLAGFAQSVSRNFGAGVGEAARQIGSVMPRGGGGRKDPLGGQGLGNAVNAGKGKSWLNK